MSPSSAVAVGPTRLGPEHPSPRKLAVVAVALVVGGASGALASTLSSSRGPATPRSARSAHAVQPLAPQLLAPLGSSRQAMVAGVTACDGRPEPCLEVVETGVAGTGLARRAVPPVGPLAGSATGTLDSLVFANALDGYAVVGPPTQRSVYATFDGARSWQHMTASPGYEVTQMVATASDFYAVEMSCPLSPSCATYRLASSPVGSTTWDTRTIPDSSGLDGEAIGIGAWGPDVWLVENVRDDAVLLESSDQGTSYKRMTAPIAGPGPCEPSPESAEDLWLACPTGMMESLFFSDDGGARFETLPTGAYAPTAGGAFDPVGPGLAFLDDGGGIPPHQLSAFFVLPSGLVARTSAGKLPLTDTFALDLTSAFDGLAIGEPLSGGDLAAGTELLATSDGGASWHAVAGADGTTASTVAGAAGHAGPGSGGATAPPASQPRVSSVTLPAGASFSQVFATSSGALELSGTTTNRYGAVLACYEAVLDPATLSVSTPARRACDDPTLNGQLVAPYETAARIDYSEVRIARLDPSSATVHLGPVIALYQDNSGTRLEWAEAAGSVWVYEAGTARGPMVFRVSSSTGALEQSTPVPMMLRPVIAADSSGLYLGVVNEINVNGNAAIYHVGIGAKTARVVMRGPSDLSVVDWMAGDGRNLVSDVCARPLGHPCRIIKLDESTTTTALDVSDHGLGGGWVTGDAATGLYSTVEIGSDPDPSAVTPWRVTHIDPLTGAISTVAKVPLAQLWRVHDDHIGDHDAAIAGDDLFLVSSAPGVPGVLDRIRLSG